MQMNKWNYIFPRDDSVIIWGAGKKGREWLEFLQRINRKVECFFDLKVKGNINDIPIYTPIKNTFPNSVYY